MAQPETITIKFKPEGDERLIRAIKTLDKHTKSLVGTQVKLTQSYHRQEKVQERVKRGVLGLEHSNRILGGSFAVLRSKLLLASFAMATLSATFGKVLKAYANQEKAEKKLAQALKSTRHSAGLTHKELTLMASALQSVTAHGDEAIIETQALMLTFTNINKEVFPQSLEAILNISDAMGQDLRQTTIQVGKALNDPIQGMSALRRIGIQLSDTQQQQVRQFMAVNDVASAQKIIIEELDTQFGGMARATRLTFAGSLTALANSWGDAMERMGEALAPFIGTLANALKDITSIMMSEGERQLKFLEEIGASEETLQIARIRLLKEEAQERISAIDGLDINLDKHESLVEVYQREEMRLVALRDNLNTQNKALDNSSQKLLGITESSEEFNNVLEALSKQHTLATSAMGGHSIRMGDFLATQNDSVTVAGKDVLVKKEQVEQTKEQIDKQIELNIALADYLRMKGLLPDLVAQGTEQIQAQVKVADVAKLALGAMGDALKPDANIGEAFKKFIIGYLELIQGVILASGQMSSAIAWAFTPMGIVKSAVALAGLEVAKALVRNVKFAEHGFEGFVDKPTLFMTGEGNKREHVSITPLESPNINGPQGATTNIHIHGGVVDQDYVTNTLIPAINASGQRVA